MPEESANVTLIREYLACLETGSPASELSRFFNPDATQVELPNKLNPAGVQSDLAIMLQRHELGKKVLSHQKFEVRSIVEQGNRVAVEAEWLGVPGLAVAGLEAGATMRASFAMFFEFREGRIQVQRNYDCFEAW